MNKKKLVVGIVCVVLGLVVGVMTFLPGNADQQAARDDWNRLNEGAGQSVEGTVVEAKQDVRTEGSRRNRRIVTTYCPVYEFTVNGQTQRVTALGDDCRESREAVTLGETATILYNPADPSIAFVDSSATEDFFADSAGSSVVGIVVVAVLVLLGVLVIVQARPKTPEQLAKQAEAKARAEEELRKLNEELDGKK